MNIHSLLLKYLMYSMIQCAGHLVEPNDINPDKEIAFEKWINKYRLNKPT